MKTLFQKMLAGVVFALLLNFNANAQWNIPAATTTTSTYFGVTGGTANIGTWWESLINNAPKVLIQSRRGTDYYQTGTVASFILHANTATQATPAPLYKVNILDAFPSRGSGYINGSVYVTNAWKTYFSVSLNGATIIGDHTLMAPASINYGACNLAVQGGILTEKVKIALLSDATNWSWPDYVFKKDYKLLPLNEVESFINKNKHLPGIPSESEVKTKGIDVVEMDAALLKKIEELTLYMIEMQKENEEFKKVLEVQNTKIKALEASK